MSPREQSLRRWICGGCTVMSFLGYLRLKTGAAMGMPGTTPGDVAKSGAKTEGQRGIRLLGLLPATAISTWPERPANYYMLLRAAGMRA